MIKDKNLRKALKEWYVKRRQIEGSKINPEDLEKIVKLIEKIEKNG